MRGGHGTAGARLGTCAHPPPQHTLCPTPPARSPSPPTPHPHNPYLAPPPRQIATVDKYQGQQNDYVLLSLVRTRAVGHIRDVRRLVVAMSRARLGLYVFGRK